MNEQEEKNQPKQDVPVLFWNPGVPDQLLVPVPDLESSSRIVVDGAWSTGVGCNSHELVALTKIVEAHQEYCDCKHDDPGASLSDALRRASQQYRAAIRDCLQGWEAALADPDSGMRGDDKVEERNLQLLKISHSFMHLSEVFLPLLTPDATWSLQQDPFDVPGLATADMVRYLRYNHIVAVEDIDPSVEEMLGSALPEEVGNGRPFWKLVESLTLRGCLDKAWKVLSKHSSYAQAKLRTEDAGLPEDVAYALEEIVQEFEALQLVLLRAPIPGGASDRFDDAIGHDAMFEDEENVDRDDFGFQPSDYLLWEKGRQVGDDLFLNMVALRKHQLWQEYVREMRRKFPLARRVPQIDNVLAILSGDFSNVEFGSWVEKFCAELLYVKPNVSARSIGARARRIISAFSETSSLDPFLKFMLEIMDGEVGRAIDVVWIMGGASGAALPSTLTSLLFCLFTDAGILTDDGSGRKAEFLCNSAASIRSSLDPTTGALLASRLLVPCALQDGTPSIVSMVASILEHYYPLSDTSASNLISLCRPLVDRLSAEILDGCCSLVLSRQRFYMDRKQYGDAVHWLQRGIELETVVLPIMDLGSCYRTLSSYCWRASRELALHLLEAEEADPLAPTVAESMINGLQSELEDASQMPAVQVLKALNACCRGSRDSKELGDHIVSCLKQQPVDDADGTIRRCLAPVSFHWLLLQIAEKIILLDDTSEFQDPSKCAFDGVGVTLLMERLAQVSVLLRVKTRCRCPREKIVAMQATFAKALARAFVTKNSRLNGLRAQGRKYASPTISYASLKHLTIPQQEKFVKEMLDF